MPHYHQNRHYGCILVTSATLKCVGIQKVATGKEHKLLKARCIIPSSCQDVTVRYFLDGIYTQIVDSE